MIKRITGAISLKIILISLAVLAILSFGVIKLLSKNKGIAQNANAQSSGIIKTLTLNKEFDFPLTDSTGKQVSKIKYIIQSVDERDEILVRGQKATAADGKVFLVINLKIVNDQAQTVQMNTRDYVRMSVDGSEWLAPDIHNDPVEVQAISTKYTRLGFAIDGSVKKLTLKVGEINGTKQDVPIVFK